MVDTNSKPATSGYHIALARSDSDAGKPYLGDPEVIGGLLRTYAAEICARHAKVADGSMERDAAVAGDRAGAERLASIFLGQNAAYEPIGEWNTAGDIAEWAKANVELIENSLRPDEAMQVFFGLFAMDVYAAIQLQLDGASDSDWQAKLDGAIDDYGRLLLGLPVETEDEG